MLCNAIDCFLKAYSPVNYTGSPRVLYKTCTLHKHKHIIRRLVPSVLLSKMSKLGDAGTIDHFGLAFQYQITKIIKK